jgi:hypothetical protein
VILLASLLSLRQDDMETVSVLTSSVQSFPNGRLSSYVRCDLIGCSQVGNAAYHNDHLYDQLQRCIPHLTNLLLGDEEDKTKANAAGALSNLVRNSSRLCDDIISKGAMQVCTRCTIGQVPEM